MNYLLIACDVFKDAIEEIISKTSYQITPVYLKLEAHLDPQKLHQDLQNMIDQADKEPYHMILLAYGLCGNATNGITARSIPIVIPKAHDCCTLFLGSVDKFLEHFGENLSASWTSSSYLAKSYNGMYSGNIEHSLSYFGLSEEFAELVKEYGEDNAQYLWDTLGSKEEHNKNIFYIATGAPDDQANIEKLKKEAQEKGQEFRLITGDLGLIKGLLAEKWNDEYLLIRPGERISATNDLETVIKVEKTPNVEKKVQNR